MLWPAVVSRSRHAHAVHALQPIASTEEVIEDGGIRFQVRVIARLAEKPRPAAVSASAKVNPFLPVDPALRVGDLSATHVAVLNKFPVIDHHLLVVTRRFVPQEALLDEHDFVAMAACLAQVNGLAFYNGGTVAGASQPHKHLQLVPLPLAPDGPEVPVEPSLQETPADSLADRAACLPFEHRFVRLNPALFTREGEAGQILAEHYRSLLHAAGMEAVAGAHGPMQSRPYNLLFTRRWMLLVPRLAECFGPISINALGFAGALLVKNPDELALLATHGPMHALRSVAAPPS